VSTIVVVGGGSGGGGGQNKASVTETPDGAFIEGSNGALVARFDTRADAIAYLQSLEGAGLSAEAPEE
jgi:hypothetical protein